MPIAIKAAGDGDVDLRRQRQLRAVRRASAADYTYFEGITFRNAEIAILAGTQFIAGSKGLTVKRSRFENVGAGVFTNYSGSSNFYIADNYVHRPQRPESPDRLGRRHCGRKFRGVEGQIFPPAMASYVAVKLYGPGHVVAYNYIADFHDGINIETYGNPDGSVASGPGIVDGPKYPPREYWDRRPVAIDFYNNYITQLPRQPDRGRRQHAQHPRAAEHVHQPRLARVLQPAGARRARLLDSQHRLSPAGRLDAADERRRPACSSTTTRSWRRPRPRARRTRTGATT